MFFNKSKIRPPAQHLIDLLNNEPDKFTGNGYTIKHPTMSMGLWIANDSWGISLYAPFGGEAKCFNGEERKAIWEAFCNNTHKIYSNERVN